jgi:methionyl-tRNA formyltransferase
MNIAIISNSDEFIPLAYTLASQGKQLSIFLSPPQDPYIFQKVSGWLQSANIPFVMEADHQTDVYRWLEQTKPDVLFVFGYRYLLDVKQIRMPAFNIHGGPLPSFRGPSPVFWQLKRGLPFVELSIQRLSAKFDDGAVVWTKRVDNLPHYNYSFVQQLFSHLCIEGVSFILQQQLSVPDLTLDTEIGAYHKRPQLADVLINWQQMKAKEICDLIRACNPWNKGALTVFNQQEVKIMDAVVVDVVVSEAAGTIVQDEEFLLVACRDGDIVNINMLFVNEFFVPAYQAMTWGFVKGKIFG